MRVEAQQLPRRDGVRAPRIINDPTVGNGPTAELAVAAADHAPRPEFVRKSPGCASRGFLVQWSSRLWHIVIVAILWEAQRFAQRCRSNMVQPLHL